MTEEVNNGKLFGRIAQVMGKVRSLPKDGHNKQSDYRYITSDTALEAIGKAMAEFGVCVIPSIANYETVTEGKMTRCKVEFDMHICCADGDTFTSRWIAEGIDYGNADKALTKAITYATKTFLIKLFVVGAGGEDPDGESAPVELASNRQQAQRPQQPVRQAPPAVNATHRQPEQPKALPAPAAESFEAIPNATESDNAIATEAVTIAAGLSSPQAAQLWAIDGKWCSNTHHAQNRWAQLAKAKFSNRVTPANLKAVIAAFVEDCLSKPKVQIEAQPETA